MFIHTDAALNWLGVDSPAAALRVLQWQGLPARFVTAGGGSLLVDRVWVQALIGRHGPKPRWVPMDPAFKQYQVTPASPLATSVPFDESAYLHLSPADRRTAYEFLASNLQNSLNATAPGTTVDDVVRKSSIIPTVFPTVLGSSSFIPCGRTFSQAAIESKIPEPSAPPVTLRLHLEAECHDTSVRRNSSIPHNAPIRLAITRRSKRSFSCGLAP